MRHWLQLATRNWRVKPGRSTAVIGAVALGVGTVITVTTIYASVEATISEQIVDNWLGRSHISIESPGGHWGSISQALAQEVARIDGIEKVTFRLKRRVGLLISIRPEDLPAGSYTGTDGRLDIDAIGVDPASEYAFREYARLEGRRIAVGDRNVAVIDKKLAGDLGLKAGSKITIEAYVDGPSRELEIVGLLATRRVAIFQRPTLYVPLLDLQETRGEVGKVTSIDCIVSDPSPEGLRACADRVGELVRQRRLGEQVTTASAKLDQLLQAQKITRLILTLVAFVALLTAFFIILTTMSMGMMERISLLGTIRCLGVTRAQLGAIVLTEAIPLGVVGVLLGLPAGFGLTKLGVAFVPHLGQYVQEIVVSPWGIGLAVVGGLVTTLAAALALLLPAARVTPLMALAAQARGGRVGIVWWAAAGGIALLACHELMIEYVEPTAWFNPPVAFAATATLYGGYMLIAPALVWLVGALAVNGVAPVFGVRRELAQDQVGRAPWRGAGVCWMLMVGLSLIVYFAVRGESIIHAWDFPSRLAGTFVWTQEPVDRAVVDRVNALPGVGQTTPILDVVCKIPPKHATFLSKFRTQSVFAASHPDTFLSMAKLEFLQGSMEDARPKLERGGYILLPPEASHAFGYNLGDKVPVTIANRTVEFEVAGVVVSPAMDIAVAYFQADSYMMLASACSVLGTLADLERHFGITSVSMFLMNVDLEPGEVPVEFSADGAPLASLPEVAKLLGAWLPHLPNERERMSVADPKVTAWLDRTTKNLDPVAKRELRRYQRAVRTVGKQWAELAPPQRWEIFREQLVIEKVKREMRRPHAITGSLRRLKQDIDADIRQATLIVSSIPALSLLVATLGVANLMMVNITARTRSIAILRAVGSTKSQIARLVLVEAFVLGLLGSSVGVVLGLHSARSTSILVTRLIGIEIPFVVPWPRVIAAVALTWAVCLLAGIAPALRASRNNVIDALQQA